MKTSKMKHYFRIMLGRKSIYAEEAYQSNIIGADFGIEKDLTNHLPDKWRDFSQEFMPLYLKIHPDKTRVAAGLACGMLWTIAKGIQIGDIVICPDGKGNYYVGEITSKYEYRKGQSLPHRRKVRWFSDNITRDDMSESLINSARSIGTVSNISKHVEELENLIAGKHPSLITTTDETIEVDPILRTG